MNQILGDFKIYLLETGRVTSQMTIQSYLGNVKQVLEWLEASNKTIDDLDRVLALKYLEYLKNKDYKPSTYNTKINSLINFSSYLKDQEIIVKDIVFGKDKIQLSGNRKVEVYSEEEMKLIEAYLENEDISQRDSLILTILAKTGIRASELTGLQLKNIDIIGQQIEVEGKNNKRRSLPIKTSLATDINEYISGDRRNNKHSENYLFVSERSSKLHRNTVLDIVVYDSLKVPQILIENSPR